MDEWTAGAFVAACSRRLSTACPVGLGEDAGHEGTVRHVGSTRRRKLTEQYVKMHVRLPDGVWW